jgi:hypothetical protein
VNGTSSAFAEVRCPTSPAGLHILRGGIEATGADVVQIDEYPTNDTGGAPGTIAWGADVFNSGAGTESFTVFAICAAPDSTSSNF